MSSSQEAGYNQVRHNKTNSRTRYGGMPEEQMRHVVQNQGNNFTLQRQAPNEPRYPDYRISSGRKHAEQPPQQQRNYQTFSQNESGGQQRQGDPYHMDSEELSEYPGEQMDYGEGDEGTSQISPTQTSPDPEMRGQLQDGASDLQDTKTENLRDFMEQARPGDAMLSSQGVSMNGHSQSSVYNGQRRVNLPLSQNTGGPDSQPPVDSGSGDRTDEKEGGQPEPRAGQNSYAGLPQRPNAYENVAEESSAVISQTDGPSQRSPDAAARIQMDPEESQLSSPIVDSASPGKQRGDDSESLSPLRDSEL